MIYLFGGTVFTTLRKNLILAPVILMCSVVVSGCASTQPDVSPTGQVITTVVIPDAQANDSLDLLEAGQQLPASSPSNTKSVRWGGTIARVENLAEQSTLVEIVSRPLGRNGRPVHNDQSEGRFFAYIDKFLDPQIVEPGRDITVVGTLVARQSGMIGQAPYVFPVIASQSINYWETQAVTRHRYMPYWGPHRGSYSRRRSGLFYDPWIYNRRPGFRLR